MGAPKYHISKRPNIENDCYGAGRQLMNPSIEHILGDETPRVWSFIVTIFGDMARKEGRYISSRTLTQLTAQIRVKPEATRVALHRLRKEDWLESKKFGRESHYRLSDNGLKLSREAAFRIYGTTPKQTAILALYDPNSVAPNGLRLSSAMSLVMSECDGAMNIPVRDPLPIWMVDRLVGSDIQSAALKLQARSAELPTTLGFSELDRAVLRLSLVHEWRRVILRIPDLPDVLFEKAFSLGDLRRSVRRLLASLSDVSLNQIVGE